VLDMLYGDCPIDNQHTSISFDLMSRVVAIDNPRQYIYIIIIPLPCYGRSVVSYELQARRLTLDRQGGKSMWEERDHSWRGMGA